MLYVGIDNGVSGTIGVIWPSGDSEVWPTPVFTSQDYQKKKENISRLHVSQFRDRIRQLVSRASEFGEVLRVVMEAPFVSPARFKATATSLRCLEAQLIVLEELGVSYTIITSQSWQKALLPKGTKGRDAQKKASLDVGIRLFPKHTQFLVKNKDADGILLAEYGRKFQP